MAPGDQHQSDQVLGLDDPGGVGAACADVLDDDRLVALDGIGEQALLGGVRGLSRRRAARPVSNVLRTLVGVNRQVEAASRDSWSAAVSSRAANSAAGASTRPTSSPPTATG
ncbi:MAG TPA: hypothetical protein VFM37_10525 [Pseudonocardiaceae bacterium]|nr:hypothetical protein [Pseudonocardiaceae bacterium]